MAGAPRKRPASSSEACLTVRKLRLGFPIEGELVAVIDGVDLTLHRGRTLGLVGESGSGKTLTALALMGLVDPPGRLLGGSIRFHDTELCHADEMVWRRLRGNRLAIIFQEPWTALNPVQPIGVQVGETLRIHRGSSKTAARRRALELLEEVGIPEPQRRQHAYPHELSGGMRQRVLIAMALACEPEVLIADEPTSALDVTTQAQILSLMARLQHERQMALLFISHDLAIVEAFADEIAVMYAGRLVEQGPASELVARARHPYTRALWATARATLRDERWVEIGGQVPSAHARPPGCAFAPRCTRRQPRCEAEPPPWQDDLACYFPETAPPEGPGA